ncbi:rod shape-determining protein MreC [Cobetia amphilecti]|uniref:Cell shape-determining protein MreC n=1 Tax=Cobetia amphilecti TaxID=1055104 RepID=A0AAP4TZS1_9GAMM|nr:rod shape-determining protein MreC [Cobetia amphilecti]MDO6672715.1 rod shape-determining protein MreC [Cobetia amphilecti]
MKPLFTRGPVPGYRMLLCAVLSLALMFAEDRFSWMVDVRASMATLVSPVQWVVSLPTEGISWGALVFADQQELADENRALREQLLNLSSRVQRMASLTSENTRLRELLNAGQRSDIPYITSQLLTLDADPFSHRMVVDRGEQDGVRIGLPVLDAYGLVGQVISTSAYNSRVLMISDASHAVPVEINRNGLRFIAQGSGKIDQVDVLHVPDTADIRVGDLLVTSGLALRFPRGLPVARVTEVYHDPGKPFARVSAEPIAQLERSRNFLIQMPPPVDTDNLYVDDSLDELPRDNLAAPRPEGDDTAQGSAEDAADAQAPTDAAGENN